MRLSFAKWEPVARMNDGARDTKYNAVLLHTNGGKLGAGGDLYDWWMHGSSPGVGAHFQVAWDGTIYQYLDTARYTGHAWDANHWSVGVETQDDGVPSKPWTDAQITSIVLICQALKVPAKLLDCPGPGDGVGWHEKCPTWNQSHHVCPGSVREAQIRNVIIPKLAQPQEDDMTVDEFAAAIGTDVKHLPLIGRHIIGTTFAQGDWKSGWSRDSRPTDAGQEQDAYDAEKARLQGVPLPK